MTLDLREASFAAPETMIRVNAVMAGVDIVVDEHTHVIVEGVGIMGDFSQGRDKVPPPRSRPDSPVVRVKGVALMAGVTVIRKGTPVPTATRTGGADGAGGRRGRWTPGTTQPGRHDDHHGRTPAGWPRVRSWAISPAIRPCPCDGLVDRA